MKKTIKSIMIGIIIILICIIIYGTIVVIINFKDTKEAINNNIEGWKSYEERIED